MTIIVEDGTGLPDSNSYASVAEADAYFTDRLNETWANSSTESKEVALIGATDYIDMRFAFLLKGNIVVDTQMLQFPRDAFELIPINLKKATFEYAVRAISNSLAPDLVASTTGYQVSRTFQKIGPIEERTDYAVIGPGSSIQYFKPYPAADALMKHFFKPSNGSVIRN